MPGMRAARIIAVVTVVYLGLDFSSPFIAGAFRFDADESVEVTTDAPASLRLIAPAPTPHGPTTSARIVTAQLASRKTTGAVAITARRRHEAARSPITPAHPPDRPTDDH